MSHVRLATSASVFSTEVTLFLDVVVLDGDIKWEHLHACAASQVQRTEQAVQAPVPVLGRYMNAIAAFSFCSS
jgi:hypothetical protein